jgi:hypothetical protein
MRFLSIMTLTDMVLPSSPMKGAIVSKLVLSQTIPTVESGRLLSEIACSFKLVLVKATRASGYGR